MRYGFLYKTLICPFKLCLFFLEDSFHNSFFKKSASKITKFLFLCDKCLTTNEINQVKSSKDKLSALQEQVKTLELTVSNLTDQVAAKPKLEPAEKPLTNYAAASPFKTVKLLKLVKRNEL